jgi:hypothetical protein
MRTSIFLVAISLTALAFVKPTFAGDGVQRQDSALVREPLPKELSQLVSPAEIRGYSILGCLETLQKRKGISINIDQTGLEGLCKEKLREIRVTQVEFPLPLAAAVEYVANPREVVSHRRRRRGRAAIPLAADQRRPK